MKKDNNKIKKIGAWIAIIILLLACCMPMIFAFGNGEDSQVYFKASLAVAIMVPIMAYAIWIVYKLLNRNKKVVDSDMENIIFDVGQVLVKYDWETYLDSFGFPKEERDKIAEVVFQSNTWNERDRSSETEQYYVDQMVKAAPEYEKDIREVMRRSDETIEKTDYAETWVRYLKDKGYDDDLLKESGLFTYERGINDKFWNRVMFPIMDINNKVIGFGGRVMGDAKPKYLNSPETKLFDKSRNLYGLNIARTARKNNLIICEGYMDVISMHQAGFNQAVASLGTALTPGQARLMKRYTDQVLITYDSDEAGTKAAMRAIPILKEAGLSTKVINMQPYKDPDEFIKALGAEAFQERIDNASNSFMYEIGVIEKKYDRSDPESSTEFEREVARKLTGFSQKLERDNYLNAVCRKFNIQMDGMRELVASYGNQSGILERKDERSRVSMQQTAKKKRDSGVRQAEKILLTWMIDDGEIFKKVKEYIEPSDFIDPLLRDVADKLYSQFDEGYVNPASIINTYATDEEHNEVAALFSADLNDDLNKNEREKALNDTVIKVKSNSLEHALNNTSDGHQMQELLMQQMKLKNIYIHI